LEKLVLNNLLKYNEKTPFVFYNVEEVLFDGAEDKMLSILNKLKKVVKPLRDLNLPDKFAWYFGVSFSFFHIFDFQ